LEEGHGLEGAGGGKGTPTSTTTTITTLDFCMGPTARTIIETTPSTSPGAAAVVVDDEEVRSMVLAPSTQVIIAEGKEREERECFVLGGKPGTKINILIRCIRIC
jgi:hypothetical protein